MKNIKCVCHFKQLEVVRQGRPVWSDKARLHLILDSEVSPWYLTVRTFRELNGVETQATACNLNSLKKIDGLKKKKKPDHLFNQPRTESKRQPHTRKTISTHMRVMRISQFKKRLFRSTASKTKIHVIPSRWARTEMGQLHKDNGRTGKKTTTEKRRPKQRDLCWAYDLWRWACLVTFSRTSCLSLSLQEKQCHPPRGSLSRYICI